MKKNENKIGKTGTIIILSFIALVAIVNTCRSEMALKDFVKNYEQILKHDSLQIKIYSKEQAPYTRKSSFSIYITATTGKKYHLKCDPEATYLKGIDELSSIGDSILKIPGTEWISLHKKDKEYRFLNYYE